MPWLPYFEKLGIKPRWGWGPGAQRARDATSYPAIPCQGSRLLSTQKPFMNQGDLSPYKPCKAPARASVPHPGPIKCLQGRQGLGPSPARLFLDALRGVYGSWKSPLVPS